MLHMRIMGFSDSEHCTMIAPSLHSVFTRSDIPTAICSASDEIDTSWHCVTFD
jgi:hypothetical protein